MSLNVTERNVNMDNLTPKTSYLFQVVAINLNGSGPYSSVTQKTLQLGNIYCSDHHCTSETAIILFPHSKTNAVEVCGSSCCVSRRHPDTGTVHHSSCCSMLLQVLQTDLAQNLIILSAIY